MAVQFKTLVGEQNPDKRFCRHDHAARSPLCRAYCAGKEHGAVYALTVQPALFGALSLARLGPDGTLAQQMLHLFDNEIWAVLLFLDVLREWA